jgi:hypothetical protein
MVRHAPRVQIANALIDPDSYREIGLSNSVEFCVESLFDSNSANAASRTGPLTVKGPHKIPHSLFVNQNFEL